MNLVDGINGGFNSDFRYLTYFNKFVNGVDLPVYGGSKEFTGIKENYDVSDDTINYNGVVYPAKSFKLKTNSDTWIAQQNIRYYGTISLEFIFKAYVPSTYIWIYGRTPTNDHSFEIGLGLDSEKTVLRYRDNNAGSNIITSLEFLEVFNGYNIYKIEATNNNPKHFAVIYDKDNDNTRLYYNGNLIATITKFEYFRTFNISPRYDDKLSITQLAVWNGDKSTNGGNNYPLPTSPYRNI